MQWVQKRGKGEERLIEGKEERQETHGRKKEP